MFCKNCGNAITEGTKYCPKCGTLVDENSSRHVGSGNGNMCCPQCGARNLSVLSDRDWGNAFASGMLNAGKSNLHRTVGAVAGAASLQQKTFFFCQDCGYKFRNPIELKRELERYSKSLVICYVLVGVMAALIVFLCYAAYMSGLKGFQSFTRIVAIFSVLFCAFMIWYSQRRKKKLSTELEWLETNIKKYN